MLPHLPHASIDGGDGGEVCAAAALLLVLDGGDAALVDPAPGGGRLLPRDLGRHLLVLHVGVDGLVSGQSAAWCREEVNRIEVLSFDTDTHNFRKRRPRSMC